LSPSFLYSFPLQGLRSSDPQNTSILFSLISIFCVRLSSRPSSFLITRSMLSMKIESASRFDRRLSPVSPRMTKSRHAKSFSPHGLPGHCYERSDLMVFENPFLRQLGLRLLLFAHPVVRLPPVFLIRTLPPVLVALIVLVTPLLRFRGNTSYDVLTNLAFSPSAYQHLERPRAIHTPPSLVFVFVT